MTIIWTCILLATFNNRKENECCTLNINPQPQGLREIELLESGQVDRKNSRRNTPYIIKLSLSVCTAPCWQAGSIASCGLLHAQTYLYALKSWKYDSSDHRSNSASLSQSHDTFWFSWGTVTDVNNNRAFVGWWQENLIECSVYCSVCQLMEWAALALN